MWDMSVKLAARFRSEDWTLGHNSSRASSNASACHLPVKDRYNDSFTPQHAITDGTTSVTTVQGGTADFLAPELCLQGQMLIREP